MRLRREAGMETGGMETGGMETGEAVGRDEIRQIAESLGLWRSAMHHVAERPAGEAAASGRAWAAERQSARSRAWRLKLVLAPALCGAIGAAVAAPIYSWMHHEPGASRTAVQDSAAGPQRARTDDTALMNQIDSAVSEDIPDALEPLADLSQMQTNSRSTSEKQHYVTQE